MNKKFSKKQFQKNLMETLTIFVKAFKATKEELLDDKTYEENEWVEDIYLAPLYISKDEFKDLIRDIDFDKLA